MSSGKAGQWEVVGKPSKIPKKGSVPNGTKSKKYGSSSMPKIEAADPVKESPTIYDAFIEKEKSSIPIRKDDKLSRGDASSKAKPGSQLKKKAIPTEQRSTKKQTLEEAIKKIEYEKVLAVLEKDQTTFPDNPTVWLMDLATFINCNFDNVPEPDPVFEGKPTDYPLVLFPKNLQTLFEDVIKQCSESTQKSFMEACIKSMINDMGKGISTYGFRMVVQILARMKPTILAKELPKYLDLIKLNQNRHLRCLSVMWSAGQVGYHDMEEGLAVWFELMIPFLNIRALAGYVVDYLISLFKTHKSNSGKDATISCKNFFPIFDMIFNPPANLAGHLQKKLLHVYPEIKGLALKNSKAQQVFFPSFLARLKKDCKPAMKTEVLACLVECLQPNSRCHPVWRQMYTQHLEQSGALLKHISDNWDVLRRQLDKTLLKDTVDAFNLTNEELARKKKDNPVVTAVCKELQSKLASSEKRGIWKIAIIFLFIVLGSLLAYDVYVHKSVRDSKTGNFLVRYGVVDFLQHVWARTLLYTAHIRMWLKENVPYYYAKVAEVVEPYLILFWQKLYTFLVYVGEITAPYRVWIADKAVYYLNWVIAQLPWIWTHVSYYAGVVCGFILHYLLIAWQFVQHYSFILGAWLQENVFTGKWSLENIGRAILVTFDQLKSYFIAAFEYVVKLVQGSSTS